LTYTRRQTSKKQYYNKNNSVRLSSINSGDRQIRKETTMIATSGPVTRLKQSIADIDNESEEYNIAKGTIKGCDVGKSVAGQWDES
jgi:hypothetical protein